MNEPTPHDDYEFDEFSDSELPYGMSGVTGLLARLQEGAQRGWEPRKREMVAQYLLDLSERYWLSDSESDFCRQFLMAA